MSPEGIPDVPALERSLSAVASAASPSEAMDRLVEGCLLAAPRVALFLVRRGRVRGWRAAGHDPETTLRMCRVDVPSQEGWLGRVASQTSLVVVEKFPDESVPGSENPRDQAAAISLRVGGSIVAFLVAERTPAEQPWDPGTLRLLATFCQMRLELDLFRRKGTRSTEGEAPRNPPSTPLHPGGAAQLVPESPRPLAMARSVPTELAPLEGPGMPNGSSRFREARRFARLIATDIRLYNEEAVLAGRRLRDLARRLGDQIERGRESFSRRFPDLGPEGLVVLEEAYVEVLAAGDAAALS